MNTDQLAFERHIQAPVRFVYRALTNSSALREWMCDAATTDPRPGGRMYMWWNSGYYTCGEFLKGVPAKAVTFLWQGGGEAGDPPVGITPSRSEAGAAFHLLTFGC